MKTLAKSLKTRPPRDVPTLSPPDANPSGRLDVQTSTSGRRVYERAGGAIQVRKKTFYLELELAKALAQYGLDHGMDEKDIVAAALKRFLGKE